ncbi:MAG TPA: NAD-dependent 4,6-dehydratase LegB [Patescibacteria group bacterium]|nr:NAD-dependent 4,6-dehydratase LegB [Patescibacteria group bacterium]
MKTILITGAGGFIGSHLAERAVELGYRVRAFVRYNSRNDWGWLEESARRDDIEVVAGDIRDYDSVHGALKGCDAVFHLAALIGIPYSYISPQAYVQTNIGGTYNVLQASREHGVGQVIITSTSETYGTAQYVPIDENHPVIGQSPYSATKIGADQLAISFHRSFDLPVKIVRPFNTYGPRQSSRAIIPTVITQLVSGDGTVRVGNVEPTRDLTFVEDTVEGFIEIFKSDALIGEITNIGMGEEISIGGLVALIGSLMGKEIEIVSEEKRVRPERSEVERLRCNNEKILEATAWRPRYDLARGLTTTIEWLRGHLAMYKSGTYTV